MGTPPPDDWSRLPVPAVTAAREVSPSGEALIADPANGGIRREPDLPEARRDRCGRTATEFTFGEEEADDEAVRARALRRQARGLVRQAAMDPGDGIDL